MADELKITISAQDNASQVFKKIATEAGKVADELEKAGKDGGKGFDQVAKGADKASASFAKIDSSGTGAIRVVGEAGSAAQQTGDAFIQMGAGLQTVANSFSEWSQSAREQQQTLIGLRAAFGDTADEMIDFGRSMADSNKTIFNDDDILRGERYFATLKNNYDLTNEQIQQLMQTTADLATASGVSFEDASSRVTAAIRGEGEAAEYLGLTMNQQSIDRNNLTLTMSNQEAAQFRLNALNQQAAAYSGTAAQVAQSSVGTYAAVTNQIKDMQQAVGGVIGPWASFASSMGSGLATVGEATRGITEIKTGLTGLMGVLRTSSLAMSALSLATGPLGLAILGIGAAIGAGLYLWDQQAEGARKAQKAYEEYGKAVETVDDAIANERLNGSDALANRMEETAKSIRDAQARGVSAAQEPIEQSKIDWNTVMNTKGAEETIAALTSFISDGMGKAALEWARDTGAITEEAFNNIFTNPAGNLGQIDQIMKQYWASLTPSDEDAAKIEGAISKVFDLMANPKIDQAKLTSGVQEIYAELAKTGDVDAALKSFDALFAELESGASSLNNVGNAAQFAAQYIGELDASLVRANTQLAENGRLAASTGDAIAEMMRAQTGSYPEEDADRRHNNLLKERERIYHELAEAVEIGDTEKIASLTAQLKALNDELLKIVDAGKKAGDAIIGAARDAAGVLDALASKAGIAGTELVSQFGAIAISAAQATFAIEAGTAATTAWGNAAEKAVAETEKIAEAQKATITSFMEMTNNSDFVSQLNLAGAGTSYSQLAEHVNDANTAMSDGFRIIVGNTNAIAQNAQQVTDWATELINVEGTWGKIDDLLANNQITLTQYKDAQAAYNTIAADNAEIQEDILTIQAKQAPVMAELMAGTQDYVETLATLPPMQQAVALGWMDANEATKANQALTMAAAAANGELGAKGKEATTAMIQGAVAADPYLKAMLLDMGLISEGADGTITVNFEGAADTKASLDDINTSILTLADILDNGKLDGSIDIAVKGREEIEAAAAAAEHLAAVGNQTVTITVNAAGNAASALTEKDLILSDGSVVKVPVEADVQDWAMSPEEFAAQQNTMVDIKARISEMSAEGAGLLDPVPVKGEVTSIEASPELGDGTAGPTVPVRAHLVFDQGEAGAASIMGAADAALAGMGDAYTIHVEADVADAVIGLYNLQTQADTLSASNPTLTVTAELGNTQSDLDKLASTNIDDKHFAIFGDATIGLAAVDNVNGAGVDDKSFAIFGDATIALAAIDNVNNAVVEDKTMTINVVTAYSTTGTPPKATAHGGLLHYATGGLIPHIAAEGNRPEMAHYANGGMAILPTEGLYFNPPNTYISPAPANPGIRGGFSVTFTGNFYGSNRAEMDAWARESLIPQFRDELLNHQRAMGGR